MSTNARRLQFAVIVPNWNGALHLKYCLPSILEALDPEDLIALVDDRSNDESLKFTEQLSGRIQRLVNTRRQGFAGSVNTGLDWAFNQKMADYVFVANNDIMIDDETIVRTKETLTNSPVPCIGLLGYLEYNPPYSLPDLKAYMPQADLGPMEDKGAIPGCLFVVSKEAFRRVGFFDESYFMYGEDNDYFYRIKSQGLKILQCQFPVWHRGEGSSRGSLRASWLAYKNALRFALKNLPFVLILRTMLSLFNQAINPFYKGKRKDPSYLRLSRHRWPVNLALLFGGIFWNILHLPETLRTRKTLTRGTSR